MSKSIEDLRAALFATLNAVKDGTLDVDRARVINEVGRTLCDTARVEVAYYNATGRGQSGFLEAEKPHQGPRLVGEAEKPQQGSRPAEQNPFGGITRHLLRG
jgi:hypothetical protein